MPVTYASYLKLDELLALQQPRSDGPEHDELLFIIVHQVYELWFKELLHELDYLIGLLRANDRTRAPHTLKRILTVLKVMVAQIDILETMTPLEFLSFRDRLESGSGFQSQQFRELECLLGVKRAEHRERYPEARFRAAGLTNLRFFPQLVAVTPEIEPARIDVFETQILGALAAEEATEWRQAAITARAEGTFFIASPFHCAVGTKPA